MSGWGTKHDIVYEDPPDATVRAYAAQSAAFYRSLHARFDISFEDFSDRDAGFYAKINGNPKTWFTPADFRRHLLYAQTFMRCAGLRMVAWQIPLGNTLMRAMNNTWDHFQDNRVQWILGSRAHLRAYVAAGFAGFLFGRGADGATCACDAAKDGVTNPRADQRQHAHSLSADDDGGLFKALTRAYYRGRRDCAAAVTVVACLGDSITEGSPYWDSRRAGGDPEGPVGALGGAAAPGARAAQLRHLGRAHGRDRGALRRGGRRAPTC